MDRIIRALLKDLENVLGPKGSGKVIHYYYGKPDEMPLNVSTNGAIFLQPVVTDSTPVATGLRDRIEDNLEIILVKSARVQRYQKADEADGIAFLTRVMSGTDSKGQRLTDTVLYTVRTNFQDYGERQPNLSIAWNDDRFNQSDIVTATMTVTQENIQNQGVS